MDIFGLIKREEDSIKLMGRATATTTMPDCEGRACSGQSESQRLWRINEQLASELRRRGGGSEEKCLPQKVLTPLAHRDQHHPHPFHRHILPCRSQLHLDGRARSTCRQWKTRRLVWDANMKESVHNLHHFFSNRNAMYSHPIPIPFQPGKKR